MQGANNTKAHTWRYIKYGSVLLYVEMKLTHEWFYQSPPLYEYAFAGEFASQKRKTTVIFLCVSYPCPQRTDDTTLLFIGKPFMKIVVISGFWYMFELGTDFGMGYVPY